MSPFASLFVLGVVVLLAGWWCVTAIYNHAPEQEPQESEWDARDRGQRCTVEGCRVEASVHVHAGHDWYPFCAEHGTPYLTEGLAK